MLKRGGEEGLNSSQAEKVSSDALRRVVKVTLKSATKGGGGSQKSSEKALRNC